MYQQMLTIQFDKCHNSGKSRISRENTGERLQWPGHVSRGKNFKCGSKVLRVNTDIYPGGLRMD